MPTIKKNVTKNINNRICHQVIFSTEHKIAEKYGLESSTITTGLLT